ncbi:MAG: DUF349 domain-containing protein [Bacteroidota bacterium]|jgi:hypothetical protein
MTNQMNPESLNPAIENPELNAAGESSANNTTIDAQQAINTSTFSDELPILLTDEHAEDHEQAEDDKELEGFDEDAIDYSSFTKQELIKITLEAVKEKELGEAASILKTVKPSLDQLLQEEYNEALQRFIEDGGLKDDFEYRDKDNTREIFNQAFKELKQKRAEEKARQEKDKLDNLKKKEAILDQIRVLSETEETKDSLRKIKELQVEWKQIRNVPKNELDRLWESYKLHLDRFYDRLSIFNELKELDRRKNLDQKIDLTKKVAELVQEASTKKTLILLKKYQEDWRNIGPVPPESNEEIWNRFKQECDKVYEMIKAVMEENQRKREDNLSAKKALLAKALELSNIKTARIKEWHECTNVANSLMDDWKKIGMVPLKYRESIWDEFREARNQFFNNKNVFFKQLHHERNENLKFKNNLIEKAEQLAAKPMDWNKQTVELKKLQEEWKKSGPVHDKISDAVWKRFRSACDMFFEKKAQHFASQVEEQKQNLEVKKALIGKLEGLLNKEDSTEVINELKAIQDEWNNAGFVPIGEKEAVQKKYSELNDQVFNKFKQATKELKDLKDKSHFEALVNAPNGIQKLKREERIVIERIKGLKGDIDTWENNIGFFSKSKGSNPMIEQATEKIAITRRHIANLEEKLKAIRGFLKQEQR